MSDELISAQIRENGESAYSVDINVSGHLLTGDEPVSFGGGNLGPAPYDLLLAALGECTAMTIRWFARQRDWPLERVEVKMTHQKGDVEGRPGKTDIFTKTITLHGPALTEDQHRKLIDVASKCPVQRTLDSTPVITTLAG